MAKAGLTTAAKDISQGGIIGTAIMLAECSGVEIVNRYRGGYRRPLAFDLAAMAEQFSELRLFALGRAGEHVQAVIEHFWDTRDCGRRYRGGEKRQPGDDRKAK